MAVLLKRRQLGVEAVPRTSSSRRTVGESESIRTEHSLTPKRIGGGAGTVTGRCGKGLPIGLVRRTVRCRVKPKEKSPKSLRTDSEDKLNHSFSCSQVYHKSRSRRILDTETSILDPLETTHFVGIKSTFSQRKLTKSPDKANNAHSDYLRGRDILEEVIRTDAKAKPLLRVVRTAYEEYVQALESDVELLTKDLKAANETVIAHQISVRKLESLVSTLQTKVQNLKFELDFRIFEAREKAEDTPAELSSTREEELQTLKKRIRLCTKLLDFMQAKGIPVMETYREMKFQNKSTRDSNRSEFVSLSDLKPPEEKPVGKPARRTLPDIPKIVLPQQCDRKPDFQEEFFSKYDEFSESWRKQVTETQSRLFGELLQ